MFCKSLNEKSQNIKRKVVIIISLFAGLISFNGCFSQEIKLSNHNNTSFFTIIPPSSIPAEAFTIKKPGSYILSGDRLCKDTGIIIESSNVTIDFQGYQLKGSGSESGLNYGILTNNYSNIEIKNGTICNFGDRGIVDRGKDQETAYKRILNMRIIDNGKCGICIGGPGNQVIDCICSQNGASGMCPGYRSIVTGNICHENEHIGIHGGRGCLISNNLCAENGQSGILAYCGSTVTNNTIYANNFSEDPKHAGLLIKNGCLVKNNTIRDNEKHNILIDGKENEIKQNVSTYVEDN